MSRKMKAFLISIVAVLVMVGGTMGALLIISNVLNLNLGVGTELTAGQIRLTLLDALPDDVTPGEKIQARFRIENLGGRLTGASLNTRVFTTNGVSLADAGPSIVIYTFEGPDTFDEQTVTLSVVGDNLEGAMLTNWTLAEGYDRQVRVRIEFTSAAPLALYAVDVWADAGSGDGGGGAPAREFTFNVGDKNDGFVAVSGTGADEVDITGSNPILKVLAGEQVRINIVWVSNNHNFAAYTDLCEGGFCESILVAGSRAADVREATPTASATFTAPDSGSLYYYCDYHPDDMFGTVEVFTP